jgi:glucose-6-phosphate isomerase
MGDGATGWQRYVGSLIVDRELGFTLDVSRVRFSDADLAPLLPRMQSALQAMQRLEAGEIANADENRMVGHYWLRSPDKAPTPEITAEIQATLEDILDFAKRVHSGGARGAKGPFRHVLQVGIGGSALGPQFVAQALGSANDPVTLSFVDNTDPDGIDQVLASLRGKLGETLVVVVSKSGGTPETRNGQLEIEAAYRRDGLDFGRHAVAVTQEGSKLHKTAVAGRWLATFPMWDWVGGRTSVLSAVGLLPAAMQGMPVEDLLRGAARMDELTRRTDPLQNPASLLAMMWYHITGGCGLKDMVVLPYKDRLLLFSRYLQQLVMESLGKEFDRQGNTVQQGIAVYGNKGSTDQHAYVQQLRDGIPNFFVTFIEVLADRTSPQLAVDGIRTSLEVEPGITSGDYLTGLLLGTREALAEKGRDSITITVNDVSGESIGALIALYERAVGLYAEVININAYHQPGVEAGKKAAAQVLEVQSKAVAHLQKIQEWQTAEQVAAAIGEPGQVEWVYKILEHLSANPGRGVKRTWMASPAEETFRVG